MKVRLFYECFGPDGKHLEHRPTPRMEAADRAAVVGFLMEELLLARRVLLMLRESDSSVEWGVAAKDHSRKLLVSTLARVVPPRVKESPAAYEDRLIRIAERIRHRAAGEE